METKKLEMFELTQSKLFEYSNENFLKKKSRFLSRLTLNWSKIGKYFRAKYLLQCTPSDRRHGTLAKNNGKSLASLAKILPRQEALFMEEIPILKASKIFEKNCRENHQFFP